MKDSYIKNLIKGTNQYRFTEMMPEQVEQFELILNGVGRAPMPMDMSQWKKLKRTEKGVFFDDRNGDDVMRMYPVLMRKEMSGQLIVPVKVFDLP